MIQQVTKGIKISVDVKFEGSFLKETSLHHAFMYYITIENQGKDVVQLLSRHWKILESTIALLELVAMSLLLSLKALLLEKAFLSLPLSLQIHLNSLLKLANMSSIFQRVLVFPFIQKMVITY